MALSVGKIGLDLEVNQSGFTKQLSSVKGIAKKAAGVIAGALAIKGGLDLTRQCLDLGSDLAEVQNVVDVTFPHMSDTIDQFAKKAASQFGLSETMAKKFTGTFGSMAEAFGFSEKEAMNMSTTLTGLAGDVASFYNIDQEEAYTKLKSVFSGETETLKDLGIVMTQTALDSYALANGYGKTTQKMSEAEKVSLRLAFVQNQLANATGDFARTSNSWANQTRILSLQFDSLKASIGQGLINLFTPIIIQINALMKKLVSLSSLFQQFTAMLSGGKNGAKNVSAVADAADASTVALTDSTGAAKALTSATKKAGSAAKKAAKEMLGLAGFDELNNFSKSDTTKESKDKDTKSGGVSGASIPITTDTSDVDTANKTLTKLKNIIESIKTALQPTITALQNLWNALKPLGTFACQALLDFYNKFLKPVGSWVLGEGLPGFINALANGLSKVDFTKINKALAELWTALTPFAINVGKGLLWFWTNVLVPFGTWTANEVVPRFLKTLSTAITILNGVIEALKPLAKWLWENVLQKFAQFTGGLFLKAWDGINKALESFSKWISEHKGAVSGFAVTVAAFFAAWKTTELLAFIQKSGGVVAALGNITKALLASHAAKLKDFAVTAKNNVLLAKDFVVNLAKSAAGLATQAAKFVADTAAKVADTAATVANTVATTAATAATTAFGVALSILTSPITLVIAALAALVAAGILVYKNWDTIKVKAAEVWQAISKAFSGIGKWFKEKFTAAYNNAVNAFAGIKAAFALVLIIIQTLFASIHTWFKEKFIAAYNGAVQAFNNTKTAFTAILVIIYTVFANIHTWFKEKFVAAYNGAIQAFSKAKTAFGNVVNNIKSVFTNIGPWFRNIFSTAYSNAIGAFSKAKTSFKTIWSNIKAPFANIAEWFETKFKTAWEKVKNVFSSGGKIFSGIKEGISSTFKTIVNGLIQGINKVINTPFTAINNMLNKIKDVGIGKAKPFSKLWSANPITIPKIPALAMGGYVRANTPQLAMIGDNRHQGEVVAPEDKLQNMVDTAVSRSGEVTAQALIPVVERLCNAIIRLENNGGGVVLQGVSDSGLYRIVKQEKSKEKKRGVQ